MKGYEKGLRAGVIGWCLGILVFAFVVGILSNEMHAEAVEESKKKIFIGAENFPDKYFREVIGEKFDYNKDGWFDDSEIKAAHKLEIYDQIKYERRQDKMGIEWLDKRVKSFEGIEYFTELQEFKYGLDTETKGYTQDERHLMYEEMKYFDEEGDCVISEEEMISPLNSLDLAKNKKIKTVIIRRDTNLRKVNLNGLKNLHQVEIGGKNVKLKSVSLKGATKLQKLILDEVGINKLSLSSAKELQTLIIYADNLKSLNLRNHKKLKSLTLRCQKMKKLNLTKNRKLRYLKVTGSGIRKIIMKKGDMLRWLYKDSGTKVMRMS